MRQLRLLLLVAKDPVKQTARKTLLERCAGYCELCGHPLTFDWAVHHRKLRSRGGTNELSNLVALHHHCHNLGTNSVHLNPAWATEIGFMVASWDEPSEVALVYQRGGKVLLSNDGGLTPTND